MVRGGRLVKQRNRRWSGGHANSSRRLYLVVPRPKPASIKAKPIQLIVATPKQKAEAITKQKSDEAKLLGATPRAAAKQKAGATPTAEAKPTAETVDWDYGLMKLQLAHLRNSMKQALLSYVSAAWPTRYKSMGLVQRAMLGTKNTDNIFEELGEPEVAYQGTR